MLTQVVSLNQFRHLRNVLLYQYKSSIAAACLTLFSVGYKAAECRFHSLVNTVVTIRGLRAKGAELEQGYYLFKR